MVLHSTAQINYEQQMLPTQNFETPAIVSKKKKKSVLKITYVKVKLFFWNLSPIHWYDSFKEIHIDMNEFIYPKNKK